MTQAQKTAKAKFKQAIAYRTKTGVSLKEAFAHIYGKKKVSKKVAKKVVRKKAAKKRIAGPKDSAAVKRELARKGLKMPHGYTTTKRKRKIGSVKKKKITEKGILNKIHIVKRNVDKLDEAQHKHMIGATKFYLDHNKKIVGDLNSAIERVHKLKKRVLDEKYMVKNAKKLNLLPYEITMSKNFINQNVKLIKELETHIKELKKHIK
jgi:hypothetical protein